MRTRIAAIGTVLAISLGLLALPQSTASAALSQPLLVDDNPANFTPHVLDGEVFAIAEAGNKIILGGSFTQAQNNGSATILTRNHILAFNKTTGVIDTTFVPDASAPVRSLVTAPDGQSVYVGGEFNTIGGATRFKVARINVTTGAPVAGFNAGLVDALVYDMELVNNRLFIGGQFTTINGTPRAGLAELDPTTGAVRSTLDVPVTGTHRGTGVTLVREISVTPVGDRLVAIGNFSTVGGLGRNQIAMLDISGPSATVADWQTNRYNGTCASFQYYTYDVDISPDGSYFVVGTTGAYGAPPRLCDTTARWETYATGSGLNPSWVDYSGGDTTYSVEVTGTAVYVGGHQRWWNNPFAGDAAGQGAVDREGIGALDPVNGVPLSWNPTRDRGRGVFDFLATNDGLWVGSDTDRIGAFEYHARIAFFPIAGGTTVPQPTVTPFPVDVNMMGRVGVTDPAYLYRVNAGGPAQPSSDFGPDWTSDSGGTNPLRNSGSNAATWSTVGSVDGTVPPGTPIGIYSSERWDPSSAPPMQWSFPVPAGRNVQVRLYFASRCTCTDNVGERIFDVALDGATVLDDYDIVAAVGFNVGTMRSWDIVSDGTVNVDFAHVVENPLINAIEIVDLDAPPFDPGAVNASFRRGYDGTTVGATSPLAGGGVSWANVRGSFWAEGQLYSTWNNGTITRRSYDGSTFGAPTTLDLYGLTNFATDAQAMTGLFYEKGRLYFTRANETNLYMRYFSVESGIVGAQRFTVSGNLPDVDWRNVQGMFLVGNQMYWAHRTTGTLNRVTWQPGVANSVPAGGTNTVVSGPAIDGNDWPARALFTTPGTAPNQPPVASFTVDCTGTLCSFNGTGSSDPDGTITGYSWNFGDTTSGSGSTTTHNFAADGTYNVTLTVTDNDGAPGNTTQPVTVSNAAPTAAFTFACDGVSCTFNGSGSTDLDGTVASYSWDFGDGNSGTGVSPTHDYAAAGSYDVELTVTDNDGATDDQTTTIEVSDEAIEFVGAAADPVTGSAGSHTVTIPATVQAGDVMVLALSWNSGTATASDPAGWTRVRSGTGTGIATALWTRTAQAADAGDPVTVTTGAVVRGSLLMSVYRNATVAAADTALAVETVSQAAHTTPTVAGADAGSWVISHWSDKTAATTAWTAPGGQSVRLTGAETGAGHLSWLLTDSNSGVPAGTVGALTATADAATVNATMATVVLTPTG
ncbi:MAG: PKD domain-containing protein [Sporichthyaceae bacterium]|nr:PKD domain-containing protein [Sporichthyaceae bacterium]